MNRIKRARLIEGLTQGELAEKLGVTPIAVCKWEKGKTFPTAKRLKQVAAALNTTVETLLDDKERAV